MLLFLRDLIFKDFWLKLFSLALAVLIRLTVSLAIEKEVTPIPSLAFQNARRTFFALPVAVLSSAQDVRSFKVDPPEVEVMVEGDSQILERLQAKDIRVMVDLTGIEAATDLRKRIEVSTPAGVTHVRVDPQQVRVVVPPKPTGTS
jgi:YbbR domain-containing protein